MVEALKRSTHNLSRHLFTANEIGEFNLKISDQSLLIYLDVEALNRSGELQETHRVHSQFRHCNFRRGRYRG
jgi:hypothetical protein